MGDAAGRFGLVGIPRCKNPRIILIFKWMESEAVWTVAGSIFIISANYEKKTVKDFLQQDDSHIRQRFRIAVSVSSLDVIIA